MHAECSPRGSGTCCALPSTSSRCVSVVVRAQQQQQPNRPTPSGRGPGQTPPRPDRAYQPGYQPPVYDPNWVVDPIPPQTQTGGQGGPPGPPGGGNKKDPIKDFLSNYAKALIAGAFVCGLGVGVYYDSEVVLSPQNLSSTQLIDRGSPNADVCMAYGYSSSVFDMKLYVTYNPFNVYVTQPVIKSGCVLRRANVGLLEREGLVEAKEVEACKQRMNTFAFTGDLKNSPEVACVYHSEEAENQYMNMITSGSPTGVPKLTSPAPATKN
ncbi:hypothetical protein FOA52_011678 [Chlamydomonas sp. UWO 241]|nr:hypothetical protein FOA52_011678 [Chlamydomonas sp. UWO 241]